MFSKWLTPLFLATAVLSSGSAMAGISLSGTRVIYEGARKEASITASNTGGDALIQAWLDSDAAQPDEVPFVVTPALARLPANQRQLLRLLYQGQGLPNDRESVLWLNVQEIPQASEQNNVLQLAVRQRIKVFFRPDGLKGEPSQASSMLQWQWLMVDGKPRLRVYNPSLFHVSLSTLRLATNEKEALVEDSTMLAPLAQRDWSVARFGLHQAPRLSFYAINDYGGQQRYQAQLTAERAATATASEHF